VNNRYGVDVPYFKKELAALSRSLPDRTPDELSRYLIRLSEVAKPLENKERRKTVRKPVQQRKAKTARNCSTCRYDSTCSIGMRCETVGYEKWRAASAVA